jgi:hypothetical protein
MAKLLSQLELDLQGWSLGKEIQICTNEVDPSWGGAIYRGKLGKSLKNQNNIIFLN